MERNQVGALIPAKDPFARFTESYGKTLNTITNSKISLVVNKDSSNLTPSDWEEINAAIYKFICDPEVSGVVVVHGTDTLAYSAAAAAFALGPNLNKPVVFTGAQAAPDVAAGDAEINLINSAQVALSQLAEVAIVFDRCIIRGVSGSKTDERSYRAFRSVNMPAGLGTVTAHGVELSPLAKRRVEPKLEKPVQFLNNFSNRVISLQHSPNNTLNCDHFKYFLEIPDPENQGLAYYRAIIITALGAGNVAEPWIDFIQEATKRGIAVILTSPFPGHSTLNSDYDAGYKAVQAGALPTGNLTHEAVKAKAPWAIGCLLKNGQKHGYDFIKALGETLNLPYIGETGEAIKA